VVGLLDAAFRAGAYVGAVLLVGGVFFLVVLWPAGLRRTRPRRIVTLGLVTSAAAAVGLFLIQGPYGAGLGPASALDPQVMLDTLGTRYGKLMLLRLVVLGFAEYVLRGFDAHADAEAAPRRLGGDLAVPGVLFLASFSLAEHAGQGSLVVLSATADATHLTAASVWVGGLVVLGAALLERPGGNGRSGRPDRARERELSAVLPRWSRTAMIAVAALVITGTYQAWREIGTLPALTGTTYGRLVLAKVSCLAVLLVLGNEGRRWVNRRFGPPAQVMVPQAAVVGAAPSARPAPPSPSGAHAPPTSATQLPAPGDGGAEPVAPGIGRLRRSVLAEVAVAAVVIGLTSALVNTVPGRQSYAPPFSATVTAQGAEGDAITELLTVDQTKAGPTTVHVYTYTKAGAVLPFASASGTLVERSKGLGPVRFTLTVLAPGHASAANVIVPSPGRWTLTTQVMTDATTDYAATATYTVR
jgi:copper transport protein